MGDTLRRHLARLHFPAAFAAKGRLPVPLSTTCALAWVHSLTPPPGPCPVPSPYPPSQQLSPLTLSPDNPPISGGTETIKRRSRACPPTLLPPSPPPSRDAHPVSDFVSNPHGHAPAPLSMFSINKRPLPAGTFSLVDNRAVAALVFTASDRTSLSVYHPFLCSLF